MVDQASIGSTWSPPENGKQQSAAAGVREGVGEMLHDIVTLTELQSQLFMVDARESATKAQTPLVLAVVGSVFALGAVPVLLVSLAEALVLFFEWERAVAYLVSGATGAILGGILLGIAWAKVSRVVEVFTRSKTELHENIRWIKYALTRGSRPPRRS